MKSKLNRHKVIFKPSNKEIYTEDNETLLELARLLDLKIDSACGGMGSCGKCVVNIRGKGKVLACQYHPDSDLVVELPIRESLGKGKFAFSKFLQDIKQIEPFTKKIYLELEPPTLQDNEDDLSRLKRFLKEKQGIDAHISFKVLRKLPAVLRKSNWKVTVTVASGAKNEIIEVEPGKVEQNFGLAIDIGTTTVAVALVDLLTGKVIDSETDYNKQIPLGEDVLSRINYAQNGGLEELNKKVIETINPLILTILQRTGFDKREVSSAVVAGNTVMTHLFLKLDPEYIRIEPYIPIANHLPSISASDVGLQMDDYAKIHCVPGVSSYVGGDVVADIIASGMNKKQKLCLLIDLGTNGEIVLGNKDWMLSCSCSAGPAFEGIGIEKGMRAVDGAIESLTISDTKIKYKLIGGETAKGICGSGMIDLLAELLKEKIIDRAGEFNSENELVKVEAGTKKFVITKDVWVNDSDVKNIIRTKAAIFAGCRTLLASVDKTFEDVDEIFIAGGLGNYLDVEKAVQIGLLPDVSRKKFKFIGNGALAGAHAILLSKEKRDESINISKKMAYLELSTENKFMDEFTSALFIPHTNLDLFPSVRKD